MMPTTTMTAIRIRNHGFLSKGRLLSLEMRLKVLLLLSALMEGRKCGKKMRANKVLPNKAKEANRPKSRSKSLSVKSRLQKAPTVVIHPRKTGVDSSLNSFSGSPTKKWWMSTCKV